MKYYNVFVLRYGVLTKKTFTAQNKEEAIRMGKRNMTATFEGYSTIVFPPILMMNHPLILLPP